MNYNENTNTKYRISDLRGYVNVCESKIRTYGQKDFAKMYGRQIRYWPKYDVGKNDKKKRLQITRMFKNKKNSQYRLACRRIIQMEGC